MNFFVCRSCRFFNYEMMNLMFRYSLIFWSWPLWYCVTSLCSCCWLPCEVCITTPAAAQNPILSLRARRINMGEVPINFLWHTVSVKVLPFFHAAVVPTRFQHDLILSYNHEIYFHIPHKLFISVFLFYFL